MKRVALAVLVIGVGCVEKAEPVGVVDGGGGDSGQIDAGVDAGFIDAGRDAGLTDAGGDAGLTDAGAGDGGLALAGLDAFEYLGAFKVPPDDLGASSANYSYGALAVHPGHGSIFVAGNNTHGSMGEFQIPQLSLSTDITALKTATPVQSFVRVLSKRPSDDGLGRVVAGALVFDEHLLTTSYIFYDQSNANTHLYNTQHGLLALDSARLETSEYRGYFRMGSRDGSFAGWISPIPEAFRAQLGGTHLTGWSSSTGRAGIHAMSSGPSAFAFDPRSMVDAGVDVPMGELLNYYPKERAIGGVYTDTVDDLYNTSGTNTLWTHLSEASFGMIIPGTRTYAVLGVSGGHGPRGICYKCIPDGETAPCFGYCSRDPKDTATYYWLFDVNDLIAVKEGRRQSYEAMPYAWGAFPAPFQADGVDAIGGGSYDEANHVLYLSLIGADRTGCQFCTTPLILAYRFRSH